MSALMKRFTLQSEITIDKDNNLTGATEWIDISSFDELYCWLNCVMSGRNDETLIVLIERQTLQVTSGAATIAIFSTINADATTEEEKAVTSLIGGKIRATWTTAGSWSDTTPKFVITIVGEAKNTGK